MKNKPENKTIDEIKDQVTIDHFNKTKWAPTEWAVMNFHAGFDARGKIEEERTKKLVEALDIIPDLITLLDNGDDSELSQYTNEIYDLAKALQEFKGEK